MICPLRFTLKHVRLPSHLYQPVYLSKFSVTLGAGLDTYLYLVSLMLSLQLPEAVEEGQENQQPILYPPSSLWNAAWECCKWTMLKYIAVQGPLWTLRSRAHLRAVFRVLQLIPEKRKGHARSKKSLCPSETAVPLFLSLLCISH